MNLELNWIFEQFLDCVLKLLGVFVVEEGACWCRKCQDELLFCEIYCFWSLLYRCNVPSCKYIHSGLETEGRKWRQTDLWTPCFSIYCKYWFICFPNKIKPVPIDLPFYLCFGRKSSCLGKGLEKFPRNASQRFHVICLLFINLSTRWQPFLKNTKHVSEWILQSSQHGHIIHSVHTHQYAEISI